MKCHQMPVHHRLPATTRNLGKASVTGAAVHQAPGQIVEKVARIVT